MKKSQYVQLIFGGLVALLGIFSVLFVNNINNMFQSIMDMCNVVVKEDELIVHFINVGSGDAIAINFPNGEVALIDTGLVDTATDVMNYIDNNVINENLDRTIDYIFISHCDNDHTGGLKRIVENYNVQTVYRPRQYAGFESAIPFGYEATNDEYADGILAIKHKGIELELVVDNMIIDVGGVELKFFSPLRQYDNSNDYSYYVKMSYGGKSFLFTGDASDSVEREMVRLYNDELKSDYLKVAHHGSKNSTCATFVDCVKPKYAVISVGENRFGHPTEQVLFRLESVGAEILRTDLMGNIVINLSSEMSYTGEYVSMEYGLIWQEICVSIEALNIVFVVKLLIKTIQKHKKIKKLSIKN